MFEVGFTEILLISILALVVLGPEKLPRVAAQLGRWMGRARTMARQFRDQLEDEVQLADAAKPKPASTPGDSTGSSASGASESGAGPNVIYPEHSTPSSAAPADATNAPPPEVTAANNAAAETAHSDSNGPAPEPEAAVYEPPAYAHAGPNGGNDGASGTAHTSAVESPPHSDESSRKTADFITTTHERGI
jgi:sec-independent protein translocase protein TatB